jgi:hypothetical protein
MVQAFKTIQLALVASISLATAAAATSPPNTTAQVFKPARGVTLDVGSQKVAAHYAVNGDGCNLTVMMANQMDVDGNIDARMTASPVRMNMPVKAGSKSLVVTTEGRALEFSCSLAKTLMTVRALDLSAQAIK